MGERRLMILSHESPRRCLSTQFSSSVIVDDTFSYDSLPSETLNLSIVRLDASSFRVEVANAATVAELKQAVEAVFFHVPQKGPGKILWSEPLVWRQFCLCYQGHKLVTETNYIRDYGIKDGDQLHFVHHVSDTCSFQRKQSKKQHRRSLSQVNRYQPKEHNDDDDDISLDDIDIENGKIQHFNAEENRGGKSKLAGFWGGLFLHSRLVAVRRARIEGRICCSMIARYRVPSNPPLVYNPILRHPS
ncbi:U11/U12 small nuclear ribonucleoprotein 25 kDa protein, partial [Mucuna pruriens]